MYTKKCRSDNDRRGTGLLRKAFGILSGVLMLLLLICLTFLFRTSQTPVTEEVLNDLHLEGVSKIMVVAHPDDETFWGGAHLTEEPYLVVCLTSGKNPVRKKEFEQAVRQTGSVPLILDYPDKEFKIRSHWTGYLDDIEKDLAVLMNYKQWEAVVTHNPNGEYGHIHHKMTSRLVTEAVKKYPNERLYYFGTYYSARKLRKREKEGKLPVRLGEELFQAKMKIVQMYLSQEKIAVGFSHMFPYENWYPAN